MLIIMTGCMETDKRVQILISTYNGEKYLREQLNSFLNQTLFERVSVLIRDDGSTDSTVQILCEYQKKYGFKVILGENVGITESMWILLRHSDPAYDYFAFSDQDDVWLPRKLEISCSLLDNQDQLLPLLFASGSRIVDKSLNYLGSSIKIKRGVSYYNAMVQNVAPGHTQVFNRAMRSSLLSKGQDNIHVIDWWLYLVASGTGRVLFCEEATVLHRQHGENVIGYETNAIKKTVHRLKSARLKKGNAISVQLRAFYNRYQDQMPPEYKLETENYFKNLDAFYDRLHYILTCHAYRQEKTENLAFKILYLFGKYKIDKGVC